MHWYGDKHNIDILDAGTYAVFNPDVVRRPKYFPVYIIRRHTQSMPDKIIG
jgi:hypothetical protein